MSRPHTDGRFRRKKYIRLAAFQDNLCFHCGKPLRFLDPKNPGDDTNDSDVASFDHVIPKSKGGSNRLNNIVIAHRGCNSERQTTPFDEDALVKLDELNKKRKNLLDQDPYDIGRAATFGSGQSSLLLLESLDDSDLSLSAKRKVAKKLNNLHIDIKTMIVLDDTESRKRILALIFQDQMKYAAILEPVDVKNRYMGVVKYIFRTKTELAAKKHLDDV